MADGGKDFIEPEKSKTGGDVEVEENIDINSGNEAVDGLNAEKRRAMRRATRRRRRTWTARP